MNLTYSKLNKMSIKELKVLLNKLTEHPDKKKAKQLAQQIRELICIKDNYGF